MKSVFVLTNTQKVLDCLTKHPGEQFLANDIQNELKISKGGVNQSLRELANEDLINRDKKGKVYLYSLNHSNAIVKQFKILKNIELIYALVNKLKDKSEKIILFGSTSRGEDSSQSDIDLFILTKVSDEVYKIFNKYKTKRKIQLIVRNTVEYMKMEDKEKVFFEEINRGVVIWEKKE
ncbi:MAG: nucleotidyltransferase domain-containing protein [Elusimicrobia bacterium]|nr:nucleotidyltransferase domain-containing protein [Candidatus Liberimonas magnetica]